MEENPYTGILNVVRSDADQRGFWPWQMGRVISVEPLVIETGGHNLSGKDLWVNYQIIENEEPARLEDIAGWLEGKTNCGVCNAETDEAFRFNPVEDGVLEARGIFGGVLHPGDQVCLLVSRDGQQYVVLCRVEKAEPQGGSR